MANKVILMGRLVRNPEVRYSQGAEPLAIARYTLAVERRGKRDGSNEHQADFIQCVSFGRTAEFAEKYLVQGTKILVVGRIQTGSYTNQEGNKVFTVEVVVEEQEFAESKSTNEARINSSTDASFNSGSSYMDKPVAAPDNGFMNIPDGIENDLPFK